MDGLLAIRNNQERVLVISRIIFLNEKKRRDRYETVKKYDNINYRKKCSGLDVYC